MSFQYIFLIMFIAGILGGIINYFLSATAATTDKPGPTRWRCIVIGIGATFLVPLFLEIAQSKLLDHVRNSLDLSAPVKEAPKDKISETGHTTVQNDTRKDSIGQVTNDNKQQGSVQASKVQHNDDKANADNVKTGADSEQPPLKTYFIFAAYCLLAAAAGPRFINNLIDGVVKDQKINTLTKENNQVVAEKKKIEQAQALETARNGELANHDEQNAILNATGGSAIATVIQPQIGPKTVFNDPQKGRFGGEREKNHRKLCAEVKKSQIPLFFKVTIWVESTDTAKPLHGDVIFYLHDSFRPSVITLPESQFTNGKAILESKLAWGAFTVGAVIDAGLTLLEYDLAIDQEFPSDFRNK